MPNPAEIAACTWLTEAELAVYAAEYGRTGFQGGLLCQGDRFDVGGFASVVCLELLGQFGGAGFEWATTPAAAEVTN